MLLECHGIVHNVRKKDVQARTEGRKHAIFFEILLCLTQSEAKITSNTRQFFIGEGGSVVTTPHDPVPRYAGARESGGKVLARQSGMACVTLTSAHY